MRGLVWGFLAGLAMCSVARADCGSVPFYLRHGCRRHHPADSAPGAAAPVAPQIAFDPLEVSVFEPKQRALILWNGEEEILLLSTTRPPRAPRPSSKVIPLPPSRRSNWASSRPSKTPRPW